MLEFIGIAAIVPQSGGCGAQPERKVLSMDDLTGWKPITWLMELSPSEVTIQVENEGVAGRALRVIGKAGSIYTLAAHPLKADQSWNRYDGLAFWIKGDGSKNFGCVRLQQTSDWNKSWVGNFPLSSKQWRRVVLAWNDLVPSAAGPELYSAEGSMPSDLDMIAFGKSWNISPAQEAPEIAFSIGEVALVKGVAPGRRRVSIGTFPPVSGAVARMKAGEPVTVLALGDSITAAPGNDGAYPAMLMGMLRKHYRNDRIDVVNCAIGGSTTSHGRQWLIRDVTGVQADLVTIMFGYNERPSAANVEGATAAWMDRTVTYLEEVAALMKTPPAGLLLATMPGRDADWNTLDSYAAAVRKLAEKCTNLTVADVAAHFKAMGKEKYARFMADEAHPNAAGQLEIAKVVFQTITGQAPKD
jgi:lysophospholipase L1-like esterase